MLPKKLLMTAAALGLAIGLAGCGGDDDSTPTTPVTSAVPPSASASVAGFVDYLKQLVASSADMFEPVDVSSVTPPVSDTAEPTPLN